LIVRAVLLISLEAAGIPCPKPLFLRNHVLMMSFIGEDGW
jgi:RIO kinase 1